jgi:hypothetical protein
VRDNLETLYGAIGDGAIAVRIPKLRLDDEPVRVAHGTSGILPRT